MADMDLDLSDLDGPSQAPARAARFAPKNSRFKPQPKPQPKTEPMSSELDSIPLAKKEELDSQSLPTDSSTTAKTEYNLLPPSSAAVTMDVETKHEGEEPKVDPMELDDGEDQVVREIDVFLTPSIDSNTQLYVMQYPLRPCWRPYELDERCEEVRVKPASAEVEVDLSVDVDSKNFDPDADSKVMTTKQTLSSSWKPPRTTGYAVGVLIGNKLHLNPIHAVVQLRPSMNQLKSGGSRKKNNVTSNVGDPIKLEQLNEENSIGPSKKQGKPPGVFNEQNKDSGECWVPLKYHGPTSDVSATYLQKMLAQGGSAIQFSMSPYDYVCSLCPGALSDNIGRTKGRFRRDLLSLTLEERYKTWLLEGPPVHRFDTLKHLAPNDSVENVLGVLQELAHLVQGLWVPKSSLLYAKGDQGVEALARDYILLRFHKNPVINHTDLSQHPQLNKAMRDVLNVLAVERPSLNDWKFKEPRDYSFIKLNPNIVNEQAAAWEHVEKPITERVFGARNRPGMKSSSRPNTASRLVTSNNSNKGASRNPKEALSKKPMSDETREALPKALQKVFQTHKVCSLQQICQRLREMAVSESSRPKGYAREAIAAANGVDAQNEFTEIINQVAIKIDGVYVLKSSPDHPQFDWLRKIVIDLLIAEGPNAKLKKATIVEAAKMQLNKDINPNEYQKVLNELCISQGSAWVLKSGDGNLK